MVAVQYKITNAFMFPLEVRHQQQPATDAALSKMEHELERIIRQFLLTRKDIQTFFQPKIDKLFDFRITSLNHLLKNQVPVTHLVQDLERALIDFKKDDAYSFLYQNIIHAIQANIEGINSLMPLQAAAKDSPIRNWQPLPKLSFKEHINLMHFMVQPFEVDLYEQWLITSLQIEFVMLIAVFLHEKKTPLKLVKINELSFFLITATQQFRAITKKMKQGSNWNASAPVTDDSENFSVASFLENAGMLDESPFNREEMIQKYRIDWTHLPQLQDLFKDAPFDEMEQSLTP